MSESCSLNEGVPPCVKCSELFGKTLSHAPDAYCAAEVWAQECRETYAYYAKRYGWNVKP